MHIEIIGATSAGKTTLAKKMVEAGINNGVNISLSDDFILEQLHLGWIKNGFIRRRLVEIVAFAYWFTRLARYLELYRFVVGEGKYSPGSWFYKMNRIRNVIRKIGVYEYISRRSESQQVVLADNEGILQGAHNLFVHQVSQVDLKKIGQYVKLIPLPDIVIYLQQEESVLVSRTLKRGHARLAGSSPEKVVHFIRQAVTVFNEIVNIPKIHERLIIVDDGFNIQSDAEISKNLNFHRVTELIQSGRIIQQITSQT